MAPPQHDRRPQQQKAIALESGESDEGTSAQSHREEGFKQNLRSSYYSFMSTYNATHYFQSPFNLFINVYAFYHSILKLRGKKKKQRMRYIVKDIKAFGL